MIIIAKFTHATLYDVQKILNLKHAWEFILDRDVVASLSDYYMLSHIARLVKDDTPLGRLMHDFTCKNPDDMYYPELAEKARYFKETEKGLTNMGDVFEKFAAKRAKEAAKEAAEATAKENKIEFAKGLLAEGMSIEFTVRLSKLSEAEVRELASKLTA